MPPAQDLGILLKASSGCTAALANGTGPWTSEAWDFNLAKGHWLEITIPAHKCFSEISIRNAKDDAFLPEEVQVHAGQELVWSTAKLSAETGWAFDDLFTLPLPYEKLQRGKVDRLSLTMKPLGFNTKIDALSVQLARRGKRKYREDFAQSLWSDTACCDCSIQSDDGQEVRAHRLVLTTASAVFARTLFSEMREGSSQVVRIPSNIQVVRALIGCCYDHTLA